MGRSTDQGPAYAKLLASSLRAQWHLDEVLRADQDLDFSRNFMPQALAPTAAAIQLSAAEQRTLNHICAYQYLYYFGAVEQFILPFVLDHARPIADREGVECRTLLNFAGEEAKHVELFRRFTNAFERGFPVECPMLGPPGKLQRKILAHHPLAVGLVVLMIEWMTQAHYVGSIRDDGGIDPLFRSLLKHHWMEEAQHARIDMLIVEALADGLGEREIHGILDEFFAIVATLDSSLRRQAVLNVGALQRAIGRSVANPGALAGGLYAAARWTYLGSAMTHPKFRVALQSISPLAAARVAAAVVQARIAPLPAQLSAAQRANRLAA
jgi:hypothetical protein